MTPRRLMSWIVLTLVLIGVLAIGVPLVREWLAVSNRQYLLTASEVVRLAKLDNAVKAYEMQYGERPPSCGTSLIREHIRATFGETEWLVESLQKRQLGFDDLDQGEALVFWLGGFARESGSRSLGFPMRVTTEAYSSPLYEFAFEDLVDSDADGWWECQVGPDKTFILTEHGAAILHEPTGAILTCDFVKAGGRAFIAGN